MKTLFLIAGCLLLLVSRSSSNQIKDTIPQQTKAELIYKKIDQKTQQLNQQIKNPHTIDDLYLLETQSLKTLNDSHALNAILLSKVDSSSREIKEYKGLLLLSQRDFSYLVANAKEIRSEIQPGIDAQKQLAEQARFMEFIGIIFICGLATCAIIQIILTQFWPHRLKLG